MADKELLLEKWRQIEGWPYSVSNHGNVRNDRNGRILKPSVTTHGYVKVNLHVAPNNIYRHVHTLEAEAFLKKPFEGAIVNHIDGNRQNNFLTNLEYCSSKQNSQHAVVRQKKEKKAVHKSIREDIDNILNTGNITWQGKKDLIVEYVENKIKEVKKGGKL